MSSTYEITQYGKNKDSSSRSSWPIQTSNKHAQSMDGGEGFFAVCFDNGELYVWGISCYGVIPNNDAINQPKHVKDSSDLRDTSIFLNPTFSEKPAQICIPTTPIAQLFTKVSCGQQHILAVTTTGRCYSWGSNLFNQLGIDTTDTNMKPPFLSSPHQVQFPTADYIIDVAAGILHSLALSQSGHVFSWGSNTYKQLGINTDKESLPTPHSIDLLHDINIVQISCGAYHNGIVCDKGNLYTFGWGLYYQLGHGTAENHTVPTLVDNLQGVGSLLSNGSFSGIKKVACGGWHTLAMTTTGDVYSFGWGKHRQLGPASSDIETMPHLINFAFLGKPDIDAVDICCGMRQSVISFSDNTIFRCGFPNINDLPPDFGKRIKGVKVACGHWDVIVELAIQ